MDVAAEPNDLLVTDGGRLRGDPRRKVRAGLRAATVERGKEQAAQEETEETPQVDLEAYEKALPEDGLCHDDSAQRPAGRSAEPRRADLYLRSAVYRSHGV